MTDNVFECSERVFKKFTYQEYDILNDLRLEGLFCDSTIKVSDGTEFPIHRAILAATSSYFRALFLHNLKDENNNSSVFIGGIDSDTMRSLIEWAYTRNITIDVVNVEKIFVAADQFQELGLKAKCAQFIETNLNHDNAIGVRRFAITYNCSSLKDSAFNYLMKYFVEVAENSQELLETDYDEFTEIITSDDLNVKYEESTFDAVIKWIDFDYTKRIDYCSKLLNSLRLGLISKDYITNKFQKLNYLTQIPECKSILMKRLQKYPLEPNALCYFVKHDENIKPRIPHELLFVIGGWSSGQVTSSIEAYDSRGKTWLNLNEFNDGPRAYHGTLAVNDKIYIIGGYDGKSYQNSCKTFDLISKKWNIVAPMNVKRCYVSAVELDGIIYAIGGFDGSSRQKSAEKYLIEKNQWVMIANMQDSRSDASAAVCDGKIYVCGGFDGTECLNTAEYYDPVRNIWTSISRMHFKRSGLCIVSYFDNVYALGGFDSQYRLNTVEKYDSIEDEWIRIEAMNTPRSNFAAQVYDDSIIVMGGFNGVTTVKLAERYSLSQRKWRSLSKMLIDRSAVSATVVKNIEFTRYFSALNYYPKQT